MLDKMHVLGIDPGPTQSGVVALECKERRVTYAGNVSNDFLLLALRSGDTWPARQLVIETMTPIGAVLGRPTLETLMWTGRLLEAAEAGGFWVDLINRREVKAELLGNRSAPKADSAIRAVLLDAIGPPGRKAEPGPTYGVSGHAWQALGAVWAWWQLAQRRSDL